MPKKNLFDEMSRVLGSKIPRRQALKIIGGMVAGTVLASLFPARARADGTGVDILTLPVDTLQMTDSVQAIHMELQYTFNAPISFIQDATDNLTTIDVTNGTVQDVIDQILNQNSNYILQQVGNNYVLRSTSSDYDTVVSGVNIVNEGRFTAFQDYVTQLNAQVPTLGGSVIAVMMGDTSNPLATNTVTLDSQASVVTHLVELLGTDDLVLFTLENGSGYTQLWLTSVTISPADVLDTTGVTIGAPAPGGGGGAPAAAAVCRVTNINDTGGATLPDPKILACPPNALGATTGCGQVYTLDSVDTCPNDACKGCKINESLKVNVNSCKLTIRPLSGLGCPIDAQGNLGASPLNPPGTTVCTDYMLWCIPNAILGLSKTGCCDVGWNQTLSVKCPGKASQVIETCAITFHICNPPANDCFSRTCTPKYNADDACCNPPQGATLCPPGQVCTGGNLCCTKKQACNNNMICCPNTQNCVNGACVQAKAQ